jgi:ECF sigma factor
LKRDVYLMTPGERGSLRAHLSTHTDTFARTRDAPAGTLSHMSDVSRLIGAAAGDRKAVADLLTLVYELRALAAARMSGEPSALTLQATALVHEAYLQLVGAEDRAQ